MAQVHLNNAGTVPVRDGDIGEFTSPEAEARSWFNRGRRVIFVNGMGNAPADHVQSATALSLLQGCPVIGVYNRTDGLWADLGQCLTDKLRLVGAQSGGFAAWAEAVDKAYAKALAQMPGLTKDDFVGTLIAGNAATLSVYKLLLSIGNQRQGTPIFCHSQGNLIVSNALTAVALAKGLGAISGLTIYSFGSPCRYWPPGLLHTQRAFTFDPVTWLDLRAGFQFDKVGFIAAHGFLDYMQHDGEFTVNRFRWGGWGMTVSMDEKGLAGYCVKIGNNPTRLMGIFERLYDAHWTDRDDVAEIYSRMMREDHAGDYETLLQGAPEVGKLLIKMLEAGYTTGGEQAEIDFIKARV